MKGYHIPDIHLKEDKNQAKDKPCGAQSQSFPVNKTAKSINRFHMKFVFAAKQKRQNNDDDGSGHNRVFEVTQNHSKF